MNHLVLGDSLEALLDHRGKTPKKLGGDFEASGVPVASALLVRDGRLDLSDARFVSEAMYAKWMPVQTRLGDVILTSEAPAGRVARVTSDAPLVLGQRLFCLRGRPGVLDSGYLYYALQSYPVQSSILGHSTGTTVVGIRQSALRRVRIPAPSFPEQQAIAEVLGAFDDKIAANTALAGAAESLAVGEASGLEGRAQLNELCVLKKRQVGTTYFADKQVDHFSLPAFDSDQLPTHEPGSAIRSGKFVVDAASVLLSKLNPRFPRIWRASPRDGVLALASTEFLVLQPHGVSPGLLWSVLSQASFSSALDARVAGTSGSHQRVRPVDALSIEVGDPRRIDSARAALVEGSLFAADVSRQENRTLAATRDALLPQLMSGKLRVRDAEKIAEEAGA